VFNMVSYIKLIIAALLPVIAAVVFELLNKKTKFGNAKRWTRNVTIGIVFGGLAIFGTEWGVPMNGAQVNCRDAAVLTAGLFFGAPAGIIAGLIGGIERWVAVAWGIGSFTRIACSVSTVLAGFYAALLRKYMFEDKKPSGWILPLFIGIVMEVFHLTMVFLTNMNATDRALTVVKACSVPMILANGISVMVTAVLLLLFFSDRRDRSMYKANISQTIQRWLMCTVVLAFALTSFFVFQLQDTIATTEVMDSLTQAVDEVHDDLMDASNANMLEKAYAIKEKYANSSLVRIASEYNIAEINIIDETGFIKNSTKPAFLGYDMASGEQSAEFLCLLGTEETYVQDYGPISYSEDIYRKYVGIKDGSGFIQIGYDAEQFQNDLSENIQDITKNRHVGYNGYILILNQDGKLVGAPKDENRYAIWVDITASKGLDGEEGTIFEATLNTVPCYCLYEKTEGYSIVSVIPQDEALQTRDLALYVNSFMEIMVFAVLFGLIYLLIKKVVVNQIKSINHSLAKITGGDLNVIVDVRSNEEFASLSDDINSTVDTLKHYIDEASARIDAELEFAKSIQANALPSKFPAFPKHKDFDIYATMNTAKEVGGDFYDFYMTGEDDLHFLIADVSGKGIPAAMFMMRAKTELKSLTESEVPIDEVFTRGNAALCEGNEAGMFVTAWQGGLNLSTGLVKFANGGHNPPLVRHAADGKFEYLKSKVGFVLAGMDGVRYKPQELQLAPGDIIFLYTDGVTEATDSNNELFGEDRLLATVNSQEFESMEELCRRVKADVDAFVGEAPQFDDITMVALKYVGKPPVPEMHIDHATIEDIPAFTEFIESELEKLDCPMKTVIQINIALDELISNIVKYGYPTEPGPVTMRIIPQDDPHGVHIQFVDEGIPYNPLNVAAPDITLSAEERKIGGLGIYMVRQTMDDMRYRYENDQNILTIVKNF